MNNLLPLEGFEFIDPEWSADCLAFCLIHGSNQTSSLRGIEYKGKGWDVRNEWVVPTLSQLRSFNTQDSRVKAWLEAAEKDGYIATVLPAWESYMSEEGLACIAAIRAVWKAFFENAHLLDLEKFKIADWDAGWWQIKKALTDKGLGVEELQEAKRARLAVTKKLIPGVYDYNFLPRHAGVEDEVVDDEE